MFLLLGAAVAQGTSLEVPVGYGDGYGVGEYLRAVAVSKSGPRRRTPSYWLLLLR
jgi:hypothetical protein